MTHFEALFEIFQIVVKELIRSDVDRLTMPSVDAKGQEVLNSIEALRERVKLIGQKEWKRIHE